MYKHLHFPIVPINEKEHLNFTVNSSFALVGNVKFYIPLVVVGTTVHLKNLVLGDQPAGNLLVQAKNLSKKRYLHMG